MNLAKDKEGAPLWHRVKHRPVLLNEVIALLDPKPGEFFIDATYGGGGHSRAIREKIGQKGRLLTIDWSESAAAEIHANFADLPQILKELNLPLADGLLLDLGYSSDQLEKSGRGFSFLRNEPLIMTYSNVSPPVYKILQELQESELAKIIKNFGEERYARQIAHEINKQRKKQPISTTGELVEAIKRAVPQNYERGRIHPATRTFQALRIYANQELTNLENLLKSIKEVVASGGRAAIISFHSLEDRLVKNYFKNLTVITKKPIRPTAEEVRINPRARSARLRVAIIP